MKDRRKEGLWNGWKGSIDEGQKEGMDYGMDGRDRSMKDRRKEGYGMDGRDRSMKDRRKGWFMEWME